MADMARYIALPLENIIPEKPLPGDLYLFVSGHFIKYREENAVLDSGKYDEFMLKKVQFLFVKDYEVDLFDKWYERLINEENDALKKNMGGINPENIIEDRQVIKKELHKLFTGEMSVTQTTAVTEKTKEFVDKMTRNPTVQKGLARMTTFSNTLSEHSVNVATMSVFLGLHLGYAHKIILEHIYMGALFHDFGKTRIDPKKLEGKDVAYIKKLMLNHPNLGKDALRARANMADEVLMIVGQHHERHDGKGYPKKLKGSNIYDLTKIVSIANYFDHLIVLSDKPTFKEKQRDAIAKLAKDGGQRFDPVKLEKSIKVLEKSI